MIVEWAYGVFASVIHWLLSALPPVTPPDWLTGAASQVSSLMGQVDGMSTWMPWGLLVTVGTVCMTVWVGGFAIKVARIIASFATLGGGSAA